MANLIGEGLVPVTHEVARPDCDELHGDDWMWLEHVRVPFPVYPHEITALQLHDSALLTLAVALEAARNGWTLKDASAWNVLHSRGRAVFVDILSFEPSESTRMWRAYGQFVRHFILPLLVHRKAGFIPPEIFLPHRDGITPERAFEVLRGFRLFSGTAIEHVLLPKLLARAGSRLIASQSKDKPAVASADIAATLPVRTLQRLQRSVAHLRPNESNSVSVWKQYEEERVHYSDADLAAKTDFVKSHLAGSRTVLDLGCNAGEFSLLAAELGADVVAADADHAALSRLYERIRGSSKAITPLWLNIGRPTPAVGWRNMEVASFLERAVAGFDCVLALGLVHHLLVSERASLSMITSLLVQTRAKKIIVEWVDPMDPKFRELVGFDTDLYSRLNANVFEEQIRQNFHLEAKMSLPCKTRVMYSLQLSQM